MKTSESNLNTVLYLALGPRCINQAVFSMLTLMMEYDDASAAPKVVVYTDIPDAFSWLAKIFPVEAIKLTEAIHQEWLGEKGQLMRLKIKAIETTLAMTGSNLIYVDTDTFFLSKADKLFAKLREGACLMHLREYPLAESRKRHPELCSKDLKLELSNGEEVILDERKYMWNAGVIGLAANQNTLTAKVLELNETLYALFPSWHAEQLSFSIILAQTGNLSAASRSIFHYWHNKDLFDKYAGEIRPVADSEMPRLLSRIKTVRWKLHLLASIKYESNELKNKIRELPGLYKAYRLIVRPFLRR